MVKRIQIASDLELSYTVLESSGEPCGDYWLQARTQSLIGNIALDKLQGPIVCKAFVEWAKNTIKEHTDAEDRLKSLESVQDVPGEVAKLSAMRPL